ncbi:unnamed protein product [Schistosoma mattheei]|uniref:Uncharacterized protein n=1 Tax=Schistosoma mattheei TaxID=31246 RepID=A0A3P8I8T7_9TREM|nr:unnamed protein product [Schistosoma mattheei]
MSAASKHFSLRKFIRAHIIEVIAVIKPMNCIIPRKMKAGR